MNQYKNSELYHYGVPGMKWGRRKKIEYAGEGVVSRQKKKQPRGGINPNAGKTTLGTTATARKTGSDMSNALSAARKVIKKGADKAGKEIQKRSNGEIAKRGKSALDVLMNGDKDWMGNSISSNDVSTEARNRGKAALERLMYSQEQIDNKKFFGDYNPFD